MHLLFSLQTDLFDEDSKQTPTTTTTSSTTTASSTTSPSTPTTPTIPPKSILTKRKHAETQDNNTTNKTVVVTTSQSVISDRELEYEREIKELRKALAEAKAAEQQQALQIANFTTEVKQLNLRIKSHQSEIGWLRSVVTKQVFNTSHPITTNSDNSAYDNTTNKNDDDNN